MAKTIQELVAQVNYDQAKVGAYTLPDALVASDGARVASAEAWKGKRREQVRQLFEQHMYGRMFPARKPVARVVEKNTEALGGKATRMQVALTFDGMPGIEFHVLVYLPNAAKKPAPCFVGLNFFGNAASALDPAVEMTKAWVREAAHTRDNRPTDATRGVEAHRWPAELIVSRGYAMATMYYGDIDPDFDDGFKNGIHPFFMDAAGGRNPDDAGAITAWAWGLSRVLDFLITLPEIDAGRVCVTGHSRLGKTALWAGANDERFALVVSNNSGCGGASLSRRNFGETLGIMSRAFPHWLCRRANETADEVEKLPVDQHMLIGLIAPRPVFVSSAEDDKWCDPMGEFLSAANADSVYRLLTGEGADLKQMPPVSQIMLSRIGYYMRPGGHDITPADWTVHLDFADKHLGKS